MARYEGMEELLQRVSQQLRVEEHKSGQGEIEAVSVAPPLSVQQFGSMLESILLLMRDARQFRDLLRPEQIRLLSRDQHEDLEALLRKLFHELRECEAALQSVVPQS